MGVKVQQGREEINSIGGISLIGGLLNSLKILKKVDAMRMSKVKTGKIKILAGFLRKSRIGRVKIVLAHEKLNFNKMKPIVLKLALYIVNKKAFKIKYLKILKQWFRNGTNFYLHITTSL